MFDELASWTRERIPERVVHAKGTGAFGYFEVTHDITKYTAAGVFSEVGKRTPVAMRFSQVFRSWVVCFQEVAFNFRRCPGRWATPIR